MPKIDPIDEWFDREEELLAKESLQALQLQAEQSGVNVAKTIRDIRFAYKHQREVFLQLGYLTEDAAVMKALQTAIKTAKSKKPRRRIKKR